MGRFVVFKPYLSAAASWGFLQDEIYNVGCTVPLMH